MYSQPKRQHLEARASTPPKARVTYRHGFLMSAIIFMAAPSANADSKTVFSIECKFDTIMTSTDPNPTIKDQREGAKPEFIVFATNQAPMRLTFEPGVMIYEFPAVENGHFFARTSKAIFDGRDISISIFDDGQAVRTMVSAPLEGAPPRVVTEIGQCKVIE